MKAFTTFGPKAASPSAFPPGALRAPRGMGPVLRSARATDTPGPRDESPVKRAPFDTEESEPLLAEAIVRNRRSSLPSLPRAAEQQVFQAG